jgi:starch synthase
VRFDFFCKAALEFLLKTGRQPDILHAHDWSTAHVAKAFWEDYQPYGLWKPKVCLHVHVHVWGVHGMGFACAWVRRFVCMASWEGCQPPG